MIGNCLCNFDNNELHFINLILKAMYDLSFLDFITAIIGIIMIIVFFSMAGRLKKIYFILDYFYQKDKKGQSATKTD